MTEYRYIVKNIMPLSNLWQTQLEAQRRGIGREIHDAVGSALAAVHFDLTWLARQTPRDPETAERLASAQAALQTAMEATRNAVAQLYPPDLSEGVASAVARLVADFGRRTDIDANFDAADEIDLPSPQQLAVYRTAQEALTNIARHAQARRVRLTLRNEGTDHAVLEVRDDGLGFMPEAAAAQADSFGLRGLAERAQAVGGSLDIVSHPGRGTALTLTLPRRETP